MKELEDLRSYCFDLLKRLDNQESPDYTEDIIQEVPIFCSQLEKLGPKTDEAFLEPLNRIQKHFSRIFLLDDRVPFYVRKMILRTLDLRRNNWDEEKLDREYYEKLNQTASEVFGKENETKDLNEDLEKVDLMTFSDDEVYDMKENEPQIQDSEYEKNVQIGGLAMNVKCDNEEILNKAAISLSDFFEHYLPPIPSGAAILGTV